MENSLKNIEWHGHRGCRGLLPENSMPAFFKAMDLGMDYLEMDVVISRDEQVVIAHEPYMPATICSHPDGCPVSSEEELSLNLFTMDYAAISAYDCGRKHPDFPEQKAMPVHRPLLKDMISEVDAYAQRNDMDQVGLTIELKSLEAYDNIYHPTPEVFASLLLKTIEGVEERCVLQSFDLRVLRELRTKAPSITQSLLVGEPFSLDELLEDLGYVPQVIGPSFELLDKQLVEACQNRGMRVVPWTVNEIKDLHHMVQIGVDGIITDYPDRKSLIVD